MGADRFATMLRRNTNRMAFLLVYMVLEWILIVLLLSNALFSYLISKFVSFFGLKPICIFCSRVDHLFEPGGTPRSYKDLLCQAHAEELSKMGFCYEDQRFSEAGNKSQSCAASRSGEYPATATLLWSKRCKIEENDGRCPSCGMVLESRFLDAVLTDSATKAKAWDDLESFPRVKSAEEVMEEEEEEDGVFCPEEARRSIVILPGHSGDNEVHEEKQEEGSEEEEDRTDDVLFPSPRQVIEDMSLEILASPLEMIGDGERLIPLELIDSSSITKHYSSSITKHYSSDADTDTGCSNLSIGMFPILERDTYVPIPTDEPDEDFSVDDHCIIPQLATGEDVSVDDRCIVAQLAAGEGVSVDNHCTIPQLMSSEDVSVDDHCIIPQLATDVEVVLTDNAEAVEGSQASEGDAKANEDANCEISIGSEICDQEHIEHSQFHELAPQPEPVADRCSESFAETLELELVPDAEPMRRTIRQGKHLTVCPVINEVDEERMPETPTTPNSIEGFPVIPKRLLLERRESGTESLDGSIASDLDNIEPMTMDRLKSVMKAERKALIALYAELEEERSASAIAANQTMAMITRLQEEKAAMQMEALQYQRMMEQQAEYDQEALQLLNELVLKREKEKQDMEEELEVHREKALTYGGRERGKTWSKEKCNRSGASSGSSCADDCDDLSSEFDEGEKSNYICSRSNDQTPSAVALGYMEEEDKLNGCLDAFRVTMLEQLKALEEKLFKLGGESADSDAGSVEHHFVENGNEINGNHGLLDNDPDGRSLNGTSFEFHTNGKLPGEVGNASVRGKRLLPLFDAANEENEGELSTKYDVVGQGLPDMVAKPTVRHDKLVIAEKVHQIYQRLQALEADRDFLKICMSSLKKGDKELNLLQEIVCHVQDLRRVELNGRDIDV